MSLSLTIKIGWRASRARSISDPTFKLGAGVVHSTSRMGRAGNSAHEPLHFDARRIVRAPDAEQNFELRILLERVGADGFVEAGVLSIDRLQDGNREAGWAPGERRVARGGSGPQEWPIVDTARRARNHDDGNAERRHIASSATPQATESAPAHRSAVTFSRSTNRASTVSSATLAAVTGTAKLKSATDSSFMKAKKEIAMKKTASTSGPR